MTKELIPTYFFRILLIITVAAKLFDSYRNIDFIERHFMISSDSLLVFTLGIAIIIRLKNVFPLSQTVYKTISHVIAPLLMSLAMLLVFFDQINYVNFVYSKTFIHTTGLFNLALFLVIFSFIFLSNDWYKKYYKQFLLFIPLIIFILFYVYGFLPFSARWELGREDGIIEYLTALAMLISSFLAVKTARVFYRRKNLILVFLFMLAAIGTFAVAGEEISWGQRIIHIEAPQAIIENNTQGDVTLHNQRAVAGLVPFAYAVIGLYGSVAWILPHFLRKFRNSNLSIFFPARFLFFFFFSVFIFQTFLRWGDVSFITGGEWTELSELIISLGVMLHFANIYRTKVDV